jgi:hypothetical protein
MSYFVDIRFRPVAALDGTPGDAIQLAKDRWSRTLPGQKGFIGLEYGPSPTRGPAVERAIARAWTNFAPLDIQTEWESFDDAAAFFSEKTIWLYLSGVVACAPAAHWEGFTDNSSQSSGNIMEPA